MSAFPQSNPLFALVEMASGLWVSRALWAAAELGIADAIGDEPAELSAIAAAAGAREEPLRRLMKALVSVGLFTAEEGDRFGHSETSIFLKSDHPLTQRPFLRSVFGGEHYAGWGALGLSLTEGGTAFEHVYGRPVFDWYGDHPAEAEAFSRAMQSTTLLIETMLMAVWTPPPFELAVDVGGSRGRLLAGLLARTPDARGVLFDLPEIADSVRPTIADPRIEVAGGNFFDGVPAGDLYLLKLILHDWDDSKSAAILRNIRAAIRPEGRVVIIDALLPETVESHPGFLMDLNMMVMTGGKERTAAEFQGLLERTGFMLESITPTPTPMAVVQGVAA